MRTNQTTNYFNPTSPTSLDHADRISSLYAHAGLQPPDHTSEIQRALNEMPDSHAVALELAQDALSATDADEFLASAVARMADARAADELRDVLTRTLDGTLIETLPQRINEAVSDLTPSFTKQITAFEKAAAKLPKQAPLDQQAVIDADVTREYKTAIQALQAIAQYAGGLHANPVSGGLFTHAPAILGKVLAIVTLPTAAVERFNADDIRLTGFASPINSEDLEGTRTIRRFTRDLADDLDRALINVARGDYKGITFKLATTDELQDRTDTADTAHTTMRVNTRRSSRIA